MAVSQVERLRKQYLRLLNFADDAKRRGQVGFADLLTQSAVKILDQIAALEKQPLQRRQQQSQSTDHKKNE